MLQEDDSPKKKGGGPTQAEMDALRKRLMDLEQVYKKIKPEMETEARRDYLELEGLVRGAVTAKDLRDFELF